MPQSATALWQQGKGGSLPEPSAGDTKATPEEVEATLAFPQCPPWSLSFHELRFVACVLSSLSCLACKPRSQECRLGGGKAGRRPPGRVSAAEHPPKLPCQERGSLLLGDSPGVCVCEQSRSWGRV